MPPSTAKLLPHAPRALAPIPTAMRMDPKVHVSQQTIQQHTILHLHLANTCCRFRLMQSTASVVYLLGQGNDCKLAALLD